MNINWTVIKALCKRDLKLYFSNPTGYVFITLFIFLSAAAAFWQTRFFLNNLANLDQLNRVFPYLLLFFIPAITMGVWSDERRQGTDELLLTLPATDVEIVLGKYFSTLGIYTAALLLSLSHLVVLFWLGTPDLGLMLGNYFGYWLLGAAFVSVGMVASLLSANVTIGFILGALLCSLLVYVQPVLGVFGAAAERGGAGLAVFNYFDDFARGVISFSGFLYFSAVVAIMIYVNVILLGRRHWSRGRNEKMWLHQSARVIALVVVAISLHTMIARGGARLDVTAERLHTLSKETRKLIADIPDDRTVFIQAYVSRDVPKHYVQTRANLIGFLREVDAVGGDQVEVIVHDTEPFTEEAREAREKFGIQPVDVPEVGSAQANVLRVFMGVAFTCGAEEDVIPFFDRGLPTEYEIARSIRVVARTARKRVGVLNTQVRLFGGFDFNSFQSTSPWSVVDELKKQYDVVQIAATDSITEVLDGLLVVLPSSLAQDEMDNLQNYVERGNPTLLLIDPVPIADIGLSPSEESGANTNPFMRNRGPQPKPKGNIDAMLTSLGVQWSKQQIIWDAYNPHPDLGSLPPEVVFVGRGNENPGSFKDENPAARGLQEIVFLFPGALTAMANSEVAFEPLVNSSFASGTTPYSQVVQKSFFGISLVPNNAPRFPTGSEYTLAGRYVGDRVQAGDTTRVNLVVVADLDFISEQFFEIRRRGLENLNFDNVSFFLNCIDVLVGDESFIDLRNRRVRHRTLTTVEAKTRDFAQQRALQEQEAQADAQRALGEAQVRLNEKVAAVRQRDDLDEQTKQIMSQNLQEAENRRFEAIKATIEAQRNAKVAASQEEMESQVRRIQGNIKTLAGLLPPIPVFAMGIMILVRRRRREKEGAAAARRLRS